MQLTALIFIFTTCVVDSSERCWDGFIRCQFNSAEESGPSLRNCWLRCMCAGHKKGICRMTTICRDYDGPLIGWMCICEGKRQYDHSPAACTYMQYLDGQFLTDWFS